MKYLIFGGSGAIGRAVAWDLARGKETDRIGIAGRREESLLRTRDWIGSSNIVPHVLDILDRNQTQRLMGRYDVGIVALPDRKTSYHLIHSAVEAGFSLVDILEEYHRRPDAYEIEGLQLPEGKTLNEYGDWLHEKALENNATILDGMGFAPGLSNVTVAEGIRKLDRAERAVARVGGIPNKEAAARHPLKYMITWAFEHVLREYMVRLNVLKGGKVTEVEALSDREPFRFREFGRNEELECAVTPGMPSFIFTRPQLREFAEKTVRWPGHFAGIDTLKETGLLDIEPVEFEGRAVSPREFMLHLLRPRLLPNEGETDVCVMWNRVSGQKDGKRVDIDYHMWEEADREMGISAMARVTGFPQAIAARYVAEGLIEARGIVPPEDGLTSALYARFLQDLEARNIRILETIRG